MKRKPQPQMSTRTELALQPVLERRCAQCTYFEAGMPAWCVRYPQPVAKQPDMWCGEFSER